MLKLSCWSVFAALVVTAVSAKDFPLQFKTIKIDDAMKFPGDNGTTTSLRMQKPEGLKKEPKAISKHPLYGEMREENQKGFIFRLDESKGDGKGYDLLLVDLNQNGDLTDDVVIKKYAPFFGSRKTSENRTLFNAIEVPAAKRIAGYRLIYYSEAYLYERDLRNMSENSYVGYLRFVPGWYLEATVDVSGKKQKFGICDGNADLRLGQPYKTGEYTSEGEKYWYFSDGDNFVLDSDGSGKFERTPFNNESCAFGPLAYFGAQPYKVTVAADYKSVQIEPWAGKIAEVSLQPQGDQVRSVTLAWEKSAGQWQLIKPTIVNGKAQVPAGNFRLYQCLVAPQASANEQVMVSGYNRKVSDAIAFDAGKANALRCGGPLEIKVTAKLNRDRQVVYEKDAKGNQVPRIITPTNDYVRINGVVVGAGGEVYSSFGKGKDYSGDPPKPTYAIVDTKGKELTSGNLEFG